MHLLPHQAMKWHQTIMPQSSPRTPNSFPDLFTALGVLICGRFLVLSWQMPRSSCFHQKQYLQNTGTLPILQIPCCWQIGYGLSFLCDLKEVKAFLSCNSLHFRSGTNQACCTTLFAPKYGALLTLLISFIVLAFENFVSSLQYFCCRCSCNRSADSQLCQSIDCAMTHLNTGRIMACLSMA